MDFSGIGLQYGELNDNINNLVANKTEKVVVKATSKEGFINGLKATITVDDGRTYETPLIVKGLYGIAEIYIKYGVQYVVQVQSYQGIEPVTQRFTADRSERNIIFEYDTVMAPLGVWIQTTDNELISADEWSTAGKDKTARGVAVITADNSFLVAKTNIKSSDGSAAWGGYGTDIPNLPNITNLITAMGDFNSKANTDAILARLNPGFNGETPTDGRNSAHIDDNTVIYEHATYPTKGAPAAEWCRCYASEDMGAGSWDLPAHGVLWVMFQNKAAINAALAACGGTALSTGNYCWDSTEYYGNLAWLLYFSSGHQSNNNKYNSYYVRPVAGRKYAIWYLPSGVKYAILNVKAILK